MTSLRGVLAAWVMVLHIFIAGLAGLVETPSAIREGYLAVDLFFFLSGFVLARTYGAWFHAGLPPGRYLVFVSRRWGRLFPLHIAVVLAVIAIHPAYTPIRIVEELTLTQRWVVWPAADADWINVPAWSISTEWLASLLFPLFVWLALPGSALRAAATAAGAAALLVYAASQHHWDLNIWRSVSSYLPAIRCFGGFGLGVAACRWRRDLRVLSRDPIVLLSLGLFVLGLADDWNDLADLAVAFPAVLGLAENEGYAARLLSMGPVHWLGRISYSIYLTHYPLVTALRYLILDGRPVRPELVAGYIVLTILAVLAVSTATHHLIELPFRERVRRFSDAVLGRYAEELHLSA